MPTRTPHVRTATQAWIMLGVAAAVLTAFAPVLRAQCPAPARTVDCRLGAPFQFRSGGDIVINEVMINPDAVTDARGEYVELYNGGTAAIDIEGWTLRDDRTNVFTITTGSACILMPADTFVIAAQSDPSLNGGFTPDLVWTDFALANGGDEVILLDASAVEQDRLAYTGQPFTIGQGRALERVSHRLPTSDPLSWVEAEEPMAMGDLGTPGRSNTLQRRRYILDGTLVTMNETLAPGERVFDGALYIQGNRILDVLRAGDPLPEDAAGAQRIDTGALIFPGLMNIHDHITFNTLPAWDVPQLMQDVSDWTSLDAYQIEVRYPRTLLTDGDLYDLLPEVGKYAEVKALAAATTSVQGSYPLSAGFTNHLARNVDLGGFYQDRIRQRSLSVLDATFQTVDAPNLAAAMDAGEVDAWLVHLGEGTGGDAVNEFQVLEDVCLLRSETVIVHGTALAPADLDKAAAAGLKLVIAPASNYLYYGATANVPAALSRGIPVSLSTDWSPAGDKNLMVSLKSLALLNELVWGGVLTDYQMVEMVTLSPAKALNWCNLLGSLRPGHFADLALIEGDPALPYRSLIEAIDTDVALVVVDGDALFGHLSMMELLKPGDYEPLSGRCGLEAAVDVTDPNVPGGDQLFSQTVDLLVAASAFDFDHMKANFKDPTVPAMTDLEFQAYLANRFPLGIVAKRLDPFWIPDDAGYFERLRAEGNVTALDPNASLDTQFYWSYPVQAVGNTLFATLAGPDVALEWSTAAGAQTYMLYRSTGKASWPSTPEVGDLTETSISRPDVPGPSDLYFYRVLGVNCMGVEEP